MHHNNHPIDEEYITHDETHAVLEAIDEQLDAIGIDEYAIENEWTIRADDRAATFVSGRAFGTFNAFEDASEDVRNDVINAHKHAAVDVGLEKDQPVYHLVASE